ncbi:MAG: NADPH:quinone oxidoreductase family protein [Proteobacteria bacterium]|nr:NADPH:quinone oxidoreductase family protein [Pseudomonadota bacterium]
MTQHPFLLATCDSLNGPEAVKVSERPLSPLASGEIRVRIKAAALNFPDLLMTYGKYQFKPELPFTLGMEASGVIEETARGDHDFKIGDAVLVKGKTGAFATHATVTAEQLDPMPGNLSFEEGAAYRVTYITAHVSLVDKARLQPGETLVVLGAGGGVGQASVELGKALGATVIAVASSDEKLALAKQSGADYLINYRHRRFSQQVQEITKGKGADVILDPVGGPYFEESLDCVAWNGRVLVVGFASGSFGVLKTDLPVKRGCSVIGVRAGEYGRRDPAAGQRSHDNLLRMTEEHDLKPLIGKIWQLKDIQEALQAMEGREVVGKQVIRMPV